MTLTTHRARWIFVLALILALAALLRIWNINKESFWADEGWTMILSKGPTPGDIVRTMADDQHPPLYFVMMHYWIDLASNSELTTRMLSMFWSLVGVAIIYQLGKEMFSPSAGAIAALMLALADNDIYLAQEARHYTAMATLAALSTLYYFRYLRRPTRGNGIGWLLASSAMMYTHYLGGFILIIQFIHILIFGRKRLFDLMFRWGAICLSWLPWFIVFLNQAAVRYKRPIIYQSGMPNNQQSFDLVRTDLFGAHFGITIGLLLLGLAYVVYRGGIPKVSWRPLRPTLYAALWFALPIVVIVAVNTRFEILTPRDFLLVTPVIAVLIGHGLMNLDRTARTFLLAVLVIVGIATTDSYFVKPPWRQVAQDILNYRLPSEPVIMDVWTDDFALRYHIGRDLHADPATLPLLSMPEWRESYGANFDSTLLTYLSDKNSFWLAYWGDANNPFLTFFTDHGFVRTATQSETHLQTNIIYIYRYDRVQPGSVGQFGDVFQLNSDQVIETSDSPPTVRVDLLWTALKPPPLDYSVSVFALDQSGKVVAQNDAPPFDGRVPTSSWQPNDLHFDSHTLTLPSPLSSGQYTIGVKVYWYGDAKPLPVTGSGSAGEYLKVKPTATTTAVDPGK